GSFRRAGLLDPDLLVSSFVCSFRRAGLLDPDLLISSFVGSLNFLNPRRRLNSFRLFDPSLNSLYPRTVLCVGLCAPCVFIPPRLSLLQLLLLGPLLRRSRLIFLGAARRRLSQGVLVGSERRRLPRLILLGAALTRLLFLDPARCIVGTH